jgi:hypothetical protein
MMSFASRGLLGLPFLSYCSTLMLPRVTVVVLLVLSLTACGSSSTPASTPHRPTPDVAQYHEQARTQKVMDEAGIGQRKYASGRADALRGLWKKAKGDFVGALGAFRLAQHTFDSVRRVPRARSMLYHKALKLLIKATSDALTSAKVRSTHGLQESFQAFERGNMTLDQAHNYEEDSR